MTLYMEARHLDMVKDILEKYDYSFYAFGSRVTGKHKKFSDIDLFYIEKIPNHILGKIEEDFEESDLPFEVDLVDFYACENDFQNLILQNYLCLQSSSQEKTVSFLPKKKL